MNEKDITEEPGKGAIWEDVIATAKERQCGYYATVFYEKANEARSHGQDEDVELLELFGAVSSFALKPDSISQPFSAAIILESSRSAMLEDLDELQLEILANSVHQITDAELQARIADVLWIKKRDYKMAELAIEAYLESASLLEDPAKWSAGFARIERALRLANALGSDEKRTTVLNHIEDALRRLDGTDPLYFSARLMGLLIDQGVGDAAYYSGLSRKMAEQAEVASDWRRARAFYQTEEDWHNQAGDTAGEKAAQIKIAELYVFESKLLSEKQYGIAASIMQQAIEAFRRMGGMEQRIKELHGTLLDLQKKSLSEMKSVSFEIDICEEAEMSSNQVKGMDLYDAIFTLAKLIAANAPRKEQCREKAQEIAAEHPLLYLLQRSSLSDKGKVVSRVPCPLGGDEAATADALRANMLEQLGLFHSSSVLAVINPIRRQINLEHQVHIRNIMEIVRNNPFVPPGREFLYARGLYAGFEGELEVAISILLPQFENSVRYLLEQNGVVASTLSSPEGLQEEFGLNKTLYMDELAKLFGEDLVFEIQGLLDDRFGANLRNRFAHGLMSHRDFFSADCVYFWGLILRLCCWPIIKRIEAVNDPT